MRMQSGGHDMFLFFEVLRFGRNRRRLSFTIAAKKFFGSRMICCKGVLYVFLYKEMVL